MVSQELLQYGLTSFWIFCNSCTIENIKKWSYYHLNIFKKYKFSQNLEDVAQKLSLPRPFLFSACQGHGSSNFLARSSKFWPSMDLLWTNKWCFYVEALSLTVLQWGYANWFCFCISGPGMLKLTRNWLEMSIPGPTMQKQNQLA